LSHLDGRTDCCARGVFARYGEAKNRHEAVAEISVHGTTVFSNDAIEELQALGHDQVGLFRTHLL
jgi:hypothetical protein